MSNETSSPDAGGFSLIELLIALVIASILVSIAIPSYTGHLRGTRRTDAQGVLLEAGMFMERFFTLNNRYDVDTGGTDVALPAGLTEAPREGGRKYYDVTIADVDAGSFTLRATPKNAQAGNGFVELDHTGARRWDRNADGDTDDTGEGNWD